MENNKTKFVTLDTLAYYNRKIDNLISDKINNKLTDEAYNTRLEMLQQQIQNLQGSTLTGDDLNRVLQTVNLCEARLNELLNQRNNEVKINSVSDEFIIEDGTNKLKINQISQSKIVGLSDFISSSNRITQINLGDEPEITPINKTVTIPVATNGKLGVVKGNPDTNGVEILQNGKLEVSSVDVSKLQQNGVDVLILHGGYAT